MSPEWSGDPFSDPDDPAAREREQRRREREEKRRQRSEKRKRKDEKEPPPPPAEPPPPPRTPDEEFWDEQPEVPADAGAGEDAGPAERERPSEPAGERGEPDAPPADRSATSGEPDAEPADWSAASGEPDAEPADWSAASGEPDAEPADPSPASGEPEAEPWAEPPRSDPAEPADSGADAPSSAERARLASAAAAAESERLQFDPEPVAEAEDAEFWAFEEGDPELAAEPGRGGRAAAAAGGGLVGRLRRHPFLIVAAILAILVLWFLNALFQPFHGDAGETVQVQIPKGSSVSEVGALLSEQGVIDNSTLFQLRVTMAGKRSELYAGGFTLAEGMSYGEAIDALATPPVKRTRTVTIPEGYARPQAARLVKEDGVPGRYMRATKKSKFLDPAEYGGKKAKNLEGFLFPNTYELKPKAPASDLVELQLKDFKRQIEKVDMKYAKSKNLTVYDVLIIASMIEDEVGVPKQRRLVASVVYNRLREGMPLGIDATIRFATGNYTEPLTESELAIDSPYNSRTNQGLPPGPINSPGLAAIKAAARPKETGFLFYVTDPEGCNELTFAKTEAEFEAAVAAYNTAREEAGGKAPNTCGE